LTPAAFVRTLKVMEVDFSPETQAKLSHAAEETGSGSAEYVRQLVEHYLDHDSWFRQKVKKGLEQLDAGQFLTHEETGARIAKLFTA
jgi:predicted transcriptional regulator